MATDHPTRVGMVGLGRMGSNIARRLMRDGHACVAYDVAPEAVAALVADGAAGAASLDELVAALPSPRTVWLMLPAGEITERTLTEVVQRLEPGDAVVDGGNTHYVDDLSRGQALQPLGIHYVDVGVSGGVFGLDRGFCLMVGGDDEVFRRLEPVFRSLAPGVDMAARTRGRVGQPAAAEYGYLHCGPVGAGHFVKMVHNGIEYGLMAAYAEGLNVLAKANAGGQEREADAETTPLEHPERYRYSIDVAEVAELWRRGSVVSSWLLDLTAAALRDAPTLEGFAGRVSDSGEGRWTAVAAIDVGVPTPVLTSALASRFSSRGEDDFANKVLSAMRNEFGGHVEKPS
ncbi:MAG TPA: decarboxylating 6-phosphogluconate dehydrogenase [Actinomycetota bacterium]|jgi:6-phosphogluconate dehydrogenase|nr:decarboxylating 6-phosphogluconate dehydrogenase [Actinomycetota bacterium]